MSKWNPWHGCTKISPGCYHCYMFRQDSEYGRDSTIVHKTKAFDLPVRKNRKGEYKLQPDGDYVYTCFTSDFFHSSSDEWRGEAWQMIKQRPDLTFFIVTKRPERFYKELPGDWKDGYENVHICCTCENQATTDKRLPVFLELPIKHKSIIHEPMLERINIEKYLEKYLEKYQDSIECVTCGGESGENARLCDYAWILETLMQCVKYNVPFHFKQTGAYFKRGNRTYHIDRADQISQAQRAHIDFIS